ncbi:MAG: nucleotidyltransferase domain-containing protein, partial [Pseudomonadota bacterium]
MKAYGLTKEHLDILRSALGKVFNKDSHVKVFLFGSRATGKHKQYSDVDLAFKSKDKELDSKLGKLQEILEESDLPCKVDLVRWDNLVEAYIPQIKKQKIPFWSPDDIELTSPWRICPLGKHWVRRHDRLLKTGTIVDQDGHCRKNRSHKDILQGDEIDLISNMQIFKNPPVRASN